MRIAILGSWQLYGSWFKVNGYDARTKVEHLWFMVQGSRFMIMTQDERWMVRYDEVKAFIEGNKRNPSKYYQEDRQLYTWMKHQRKVMNAGELKEDRMKKFDKLLALCEKYRRVNQYE